jgi:PncC family amidohydrolase
MDFKKLLFHLNKNNLTLSTIESLTGGAFAYFFTQTPGASSAFVKSIVTYSNEAKIEAGVNRDILNQYGAVSSEVALEMLNCLETEVAISFTGNAGPEAMDNKPVGRVYIGIKFLDDYEIIEFNFEGDRDSIREQSLKAALDILETNFQNL